MPLITFCVADAYAGLSDSKRYWLRVKSTTDTIVATRMSSDGLVHVQVARPTLVGMVACRKFMYVSMYACCLIFLLSC